jgi:hypothetical protein
VAAVADVWVGRIAFALGVPLALAAVLCLRRQRPLLAGGLAVMCAAASPVAGALLGLAAVSAAFARATPRALLTLAVPAAVTVLALALVFPEGGFEPYPLLSFLATAVVVLAFLRALPQRQPLLRAGASIYLLACVVCLLIHSPMGSNVERYGVLLAGPLLLCVRPRPTAGVAVALCVAAGWVLWGPARETLAVGGGESTKAAYYTPVEQFLAAQQVPARVEVPLTRSHWEAAQLAPSVSLARGWEKQLDERFDRVLLAPGLTVATYDRWLHEQAVTYVALPDARLDPSSAQEGRLIARGLPYLREVFASRHWRIYKVLVPTPLIAGPGRLTSLGHDSFTLRAVSRGDILVRVRFTRYWTVVHGNACVRSAPGGWTSVKAGAPGSVIVAARFSLARALGSAETCTRSGS